MPRSIDKHQEQVHAINQELGRAKKGTRRKYVAIHEHDASVVRHALAQRYKTVTKELEILQISKERDLDEIERFQLPPNLRRFSQEELREQINPWISLQMTLAGLMRDFAFENASSAPKEN